MSETQSTSGKFNKGFLTIPWTTGKLTLFTKEKIVITSIEQLRELSAPLDDVFVSSSVDFPHEYTRRPGSHRPRPHDPRRLIQP